MVRGSSRWQIWSLHPLSGALLLALGAVAPATGAPPPATPVTQAPRCASVAPGPGAALQKSYGALVDEYVDALPGPRGVAHRERSVDRLVADSLDVTMFARRTLSSAWAAAPPKMRADWALTLGAMLHRKYRDRLRSPARFRLVVTKTAVTCNDATLAVTLRHHSRSRLNANAVLRMSHDARGWRVYDVSVSGSSLLAMWRSRFVRVYRAGGVPAVDGQLRKLRQRYRCDLKGGQRRCPKGRN